MSYNRSLASEAMIENTVVPQNVTGLAVSSEWISARQYERISFLLIQGAWAGGTPAVTFQQAKDAAGTGAKALSPPTLWTNVKATDAYTETPIVSGAFNLTAVANTLTLVDIRAESLDVANNFCFVQCLVASPGANADLLNILSIASNPRYASAPANMVTSLA